MYLTINNHCGAVRWHYTFSLINQNITGLCSIRIVCIFDVANEILHERQFKSYSRNGLCFRVQFKQIYELILPKFNS